MSAALSLANAVRAALNARLDAKTWFTPPKGCAWPYLTIDVIGAADGSSLQARKERATIVISAWSKSPSPSQIGGLLKAASTVLRERPPQPFQGRTVSFAISREDLRPDIDGRTWIGAITLTALIEP